MPREPHPHELEIASPGIARLLLALGRSVGRSLVRRALRRPSADTD